MCLEPFPALLAVNDLHPKVVKNCTLNPRRVNARMQWSEKSANRPLKFLKGGLEVRQAAHLQFEPRHCACDWIYIDAYDMSAKATCLHGRSSPADKWVKYGESPKVRRTIIGTPEVVIWASRPANEKSTKYAT